MYQAPEILRNSGVGLPSDVFSFGIIMWEIISGEIAYEVHSAVIRIVKNDNTP
jgi:serine/threonine protein kinase